MWVVSIDALCCIIYQYDKGDKALRKHKQLKHNEGRMKNNELSADKSGRFSKFRFVSHGNYSPHNEPKENEREYFAGIIANELNLAREKNLYHSIIIASEPKMQGLIKKKLNATVKQLIKREFNSSFKNLDSSEIFEKIKPLPIE